ncbi:MAG: PLP-dependent aminotransferase family protein [Acidobacteria bacterium]|nr:PLP-dependent aminotransferase family protein [Acidobacteriota bacterium]
MIFALDRDSHIPLYAQIATQVREMISRGALKMGDRLPANRELAKSLGVNRSTVTTAYDELMADGLISSRVGSGTYVSAVPASGSRSAERELRRPSPMPWGALLADQKRDKWLSGMTEAIVRKDTVSLAYALPAAELFPVDDFRRSVDRVLRREARGLLQLGTSDGYAPLQQYLASYMAHLGVAVEPGEILITNGCQQSLDLIRQILVRPGEEVVLENPTYPGAISVFCGQQSKYISVPVGDRGLDLDLLEDLLAQRRPKLIYVVPSFHNPTGITMDLASRQRLIELAAMYRVPIIEDDIYGELRYDGVSLPSLKSLDEYGLVIYINSFSKIGFPGLRIGWIIAPRIVIDYLDAVKQRTDLHASLLSQAAISEFVRHGLLAKHIKRCRKAYSERRDAMLAALARYFPDEAVWNRPEGGMAIWVRLPQSLNASQVLIQSMEQRVAFSPGEYFYSCSPQPNTLRLAFTMAEPSSIEEAIKRLGAVIKARLVSTKRRIEFSPKAAVKALV